MSVDAIVTMLEPEFAQQADMLSIAQMWVERTGGIVIEARDDVDALVLDRDQYIDILQGIPLWNKIKADLPYYVRTIRRKIIQGKTEREFFARMLLHSPKFSYTLRHFLVDPDYATGKGYPFGSPKPLEGVLSSYVPFCDEGQGGYDDLEGTCCLVRNALKSGFLSEEVMLAAVGLEKEWYAYQQSRGIPKDMRRRVKRAVEHFLRDPDYSKDNRVASICSPVPLTYLLLNYDPEATEGKNGIVNQRGIAVNASIRLSKGDLTEQELLESVNLFGRWIAYQQTTGVPKDYKENALRVLNHFLENPDYCNDKRNDFGSPKSLTQVLRTYDPRLNEGEGGFRNSMGEGDFIANAMFQGKFTEEQLLTSIGLRERWDEYLQTLGIPREFRRLARVTLEHFLNHPTYGRGVNVEYGSPLTLFNILNCYDPKGSERRDKMTKKGTKTSKIAVRMRERKFTEEQLLRSIDRYEKTNLYERWDAYQQSTGIPFVHQEIAREVIVHFLQHPTYRRTNSPSGGSPHRPRTLRSVLKRYSYSANDGTGGYVERGGDASAVEGIIASGKLTIETVLAITGTTEAWEDYQRSTSANPFRYDSAHYDQKT